MSSTDAEQTEKIARGRPSVKEKQFELRENMILDVANEILMKNGFTKTTLDEVIAEVGISKPTFYQHFRSKEELFVEVVMRSVREAVDIFAGFEQTLSPGDAVKEMIDWTLNERFEDCAHCYADLPGLLSVMSAESVKEQKIKLLCSISRIIERAQKVGKARPSIPPILLAQIMMSIFKDLGYQDILDDGLIDMQSFKQGIANLILLSD